MPNRVYELHRRDVWTVIAAFVVVIALSTGGLVWQKQLSDRQHAQEIADANARARLRTEQLTLLCRRDNAQNRRIVGYIASQNDVARLKKIAYYREHPEDLPNVAAIIADARSKFPQRSCRFAVGPLGKTP
jgi:hypothetical protein